MIALLYFGTILSGLLAVGFVTINEDEFWGAVFTVVFLVCLYGLWQAVA